MFSHANEKNGVTYIDGDWKTFIAIVENNQVVPKKKRLYQKRIVTRLPNYVKDKTKKISGKAKLTCKLMDKLSFFYGFEKVKKIFGSHFTIKFLIMNSPTPIYEGLSIDDLLTRSLSVFTQNSNEMFNAMV